MYSFSYRDIRSSTCVAVGEIGLDYTRVRSANERDLQREVFGRLCRIANEVGKPVVIILTQNLSCANQVYWHHCSGYAAEAREVDNSFPFVVFGIALDVLKEQYDDVLEDFIKSMAPERLLVENDALIVGERRTSNYSQ